MIGAISTAVANVIGMFSPNAAGAVAIHANASIWSFANKVPTIQAIMQIMFHSLSSFFLFRLPVLELEGNVDESVPRHRGYRAVRFVFLFRAGEFFPLVSVLEVIDGVFHEVE